MTDLSELDRLLEEQDMAEATLAGAVTERKCRRHVWAGTFRVPYHLHGQGPLHDCFLMACLGYRDEGRRVIVCERCGRLKDIARSRRGRNSRSYGNRAELKVARSYGGTKIGHAGGPVDVRGKDFATQVKTHRRSPPGEWTKAFAAMAQDARCPRMLLRFVMGAGVAPADYFVFQAKDFLDWFGRDE